MNQQNKNFIKNFVIPAFLGLVKQNMIIGIHDLNGTIIMSSQKYANLLGFNSYKDAINKKEKIDFSFIHGHHSIANTFGKYIKDSGQIADFISTINEQLHLTTCEPIFDHNNNVIAIKNHIRQFKIISHKEITYNHLNKFKPALNTLANKNKPYLTKKEEIVLFMLVSGYNQNEIAQYLHSSRSLVAKIISEGLCPKFNISGSASKILIDKAVSIGLASFIPNDFLNNT